MLASLFLFQEIAMPSVGDYRHYQAHYTDKSTDLNVTTSTDDTTIITVKSASHQLFIQKITVNISTYAAKTWQFEDSNSSAVPVANLSIPAAAVALPSETGTIVFDFGPKGFALTVGKNFLLNVSATGAAAQVHVEAYEKLGAAIGYLAGASSQ